jgi:hypothetical protein
VARDGEEDARIRVADELVGNQFEHTAVHEEGQLRSRLGAGEAQPTRRANGRDRPCQGHLVGMRPGDRSQRQCEFSVVEKIDEIDRFWRIPRAPNHHRPGRIVEGRGDVCGGPRKRPLREAEKAAGFRCVSGRGCGGGAGAPGLGREEADQATHGGQGVGGRAGGERQGKPGRRQHGGVISTTHELTRGAKDILRVDRSVGGEIAHDDSHG